MKFVFLYYILLTNYRGSIYNNEIRQLAAVNLLKIFRPPSFKMVRSPNLYRLQTIHHLEWLYCKNLALLGTLLLYVKRNFKFTLTV